VMAHLTPWTRDWRSRGQHHYYAYGAITRTERVRKILKEAEDRYAHEMLNEEERLLLLDRIRRLRRKLAS